MTHYAIGHIDEGFQLKDRQGRLELWQNLSSGFFGVYLYEHENADEWFIMHTIRADEQRAREVMAKVASILA